MRRARVPFPRPLLRPLLLALVVAAIVSTAACVAPEPPAGPPPPRGLPAPRPPAASPAPPLPLPPVPPVPVAPRPAPVLLGTSVEGRPVEAHVRGNGPEVVLVLAAVHGSEPAGVPLALGLLEDVDRRPGLLAGRTLVVVPVVNPDGLAAGRRPNAARVDLNRDLPLDEGGAPTRPGTQPETQAVLEAFRRYSPARTLSLHSPLGCVDFDGPAEAWAAEISRACALPVRRLGTRPGSLGAWAEARGHPLVTLELPRDAAALDPAVLRDRYAPALLAFLAGSAAGADSRVAGPGR